MEDYTKYIEKELRESGIEIEYDGYLKNSHPNISLYVKCKIDTNTDSAKMVIIEMPPLSEKMVMSHQCGPVLENEIDFEIIEIYTQNPV
jgi:hypothetical protein